MSTQTAERMPLMLRFSVPGVQTLTVHAMQSMRHLMTMGLRHQMFGTFEVVEKEDELCPPGLILVKDRGIYLMSNGLPRQLDPKHSGPSEMSLVVYADGFDPDGLSDQWDHVRSCIGGDDFADHIAITDIQANLTQKTPFRKGHDSFMIGVGRDKLWLE